MAVNKRIPGVPSDVGRATVVFADAFGVQTTAFNYLMEL
jgi:hypothetical protein